MPCPPARTDPARRDGITIWRGPFFPIGGGDKNQLQFYASQFPPDEANGVFIVPLARAVKRLAAARPAQGFCLSMESIQIHHPNWKRLHTKPGESLELLETGFRCRTEKADPSCFNCPANLEADADRRTSFFKCSQNMRRTVSNSGIPVGTPHAPAAARSTEHRLLHF